MIFHLALNKFQNPCPPSQSPAWSDLISCCFHPHPPHSSHTSLPSYLTPTKWASAQERLNMLPTLQNILPLSFPGWYLLAISWRAISSEKPSLTTSLKEPHSQPLSQPWILILCVALITIGLFLVYVFVALLSSIPHYKLGSKTFPVLFTIVYPVPKMVSST